MDATKFQNITSENSFLLFATFDKKDYDKFNRSILANNDTKD